MVGALPRVSNTQWRKRMGVGAGITDLKSDQSVDSVTAHSVAAPSEARRLEVSEVPRICIARSPIGAVGDTSLRNMLGPSPIPASPDPPRTKQCGGDDSAAERPARECAPNKLY